MPKTSTKKAGTKVKHAEADPMQDVYNTLMFQIEPELTSWVLPVLNTLYETETEEEKEERRGRYERAFEMYNQRFEELMNLWKSELHAFKKNAVSEYKVQEASREEKILQSLDQSLSSF